MDSTTDRRAFLGGIAGAAGASALLTACASAGAMHAPPAPRRTPGAAWDDGWTRRLGRHRTVFDVAELDATPGAGQVAPVMDAYHEVLGTTDADLGFVLVVRHTAVPMLFDDPVWAKYDVGADLAHKDPATKESYRRNPFKRVIVGVQQRGVVVLGCNSAVTGFVSILAQRARADQAEVTRDVMGGVLPGAVLLPNGLFALARAQDVGCGFMR